MRHGHGEQGFGAICGDDDDGRLDEPRQHVLHRHACNHDRAYFAGERLRRPAHQPTVDGLQHRADGGRDQRKVLG